MEHLCLDYIPSGQKLNIDKSKCNKIIYHSNDGTDDGDSTLLDVIISKKQVDADEWALILNNVINDHNLESWSRINTKIMYYSYYWSLEICFEDGTSYFFDGDDDSYTLVEELEKFLLPYSRPCSYNTYNNTWYAKHFQLGENPTIVQRSNGDFLFLLSIGTYDVITKPLYDRIITGHLPLGSKSWETEYPSFDEACKGLGTLVCSMDLKDDQRKMIIHNDYTYYEMLLAFENKDRISKLADEKYIDFFTNPKNEYFVSANVKETYNNLVNGFIKDLYNAQEVGCCFWREMRKDYYVVKEHIIPSEIIKNIDKFDIEDCINFLWYCCVYESRYIIGAIEIYGKMGLIHPVLLKVKQLISTDF